MRRKGDKILPTGVLPSHFNVLLLSTACNNSVFIEAALLYFSGNEYTCYDKYLKCI